MKVHIPILNPNEEVTHIQLLLWYSVMDCTFRYRAFPVRIVKGKVFPSSGIGEDATIESWSPSDRNPRYGFHCDMVRSHVAEQKGYFWTVIRKVANNNELKVSYREDVPPEDITPRVEE